MKVERCRMCGHPQPARSWWTRMTKPAYCRDTDACFARWQARERAARAARPQPVSPGRFRRRR